MCKANNTPTMFKESVIGELPEYRPQLEQLFKDIFVYGWKAETGDYGALSLDNRQLIVWIYENLTAIMQIAPKYDGKPNDTIDEQDYPTLYRFFECGKWGVEDYLEYIDEMHSVSTVYKYKLIKYPANCSELIEIEEACRCFKKFIKAYIPESQRLSITSKAA